MTTEGALTPRTHVEPLPRSQEELVLRFKEAISLPSVEEITVTTSELRVRRSVLPDQEVFPKNAEQSDVYDPDLLLGVVELDDVPFNEKAHPLLVLHAAMQKVLDRNLKPLYIVAPKGPWLCAYIGLEDQRLTHVYGMQVIETESPSYQERLVVLGSSTAYFADARYGVSIDLGV